MELLADPDFQKRMDKSVAASEAALEELEEAMDAADKTQKAADQHPEPHPPDPPRVIRGQQSPLDGWSKKWKVAEMASERLQKYLARAGVASRRHAEDLITEGRVTVNNQKVTELGSKVEPGDLVTVDGKLVTPPEESTTTCSTSRWAS